LKEKLIFSHTPFRLRERWVDAQEIRSSHVEKT